MICFYHERDEICETLRSEAPFVIFSVFRGSKP